MSEFFIIGHQVIKFFLVILVGIYCVKRKILSEKDTKVLSRLIVKVILPVFIFSNTVNSATRSDLKTYFMVLPLSALIYALWILTGRLLAKIQKIEMSKYKVYQAIFVFGNVGFIGIPLISAIFPEKGMIYISLFTIIDQLMLWTYGVELTSGEEHEWNIKKLRNVINPPFIAILAAIVVIICGIQLPDILRDTLSSIGSASSPLSLIYIGASLCFCNFGRILKRREIYVGICVKMICLPVIVYIILQNLLNLSQDLSMTMALLTALPCMTTIPMLANSNGVEGEYCVSATMFTQMVSLITLPVISCLVTLLR